MHRLAHGHRVRLASRLTKGCSVRATVRMTGVAKKTVMRFLREIGGVCKSREDRVLRNLPCRHVHLAERWGFNYCKRKASHPKSRRGLPALATCVFGPPSTRKPNCFLAGVWVIAEDAQPLGLRRIWLRAWGIASK